MECNNVSEAHDPVVIAEDRHAMRVFCRLCKYQLVIRKDYIKDVPEKREYARIFKRDIMQGNDNLLYKYHPNLIRI